MSELTRIAKIRGFRELARKALDAYRLEDARFRFLKHAGNTLFRVYRPSQASPELAESPFKPGQYLLRIHDSSEQRTVAIELEMEWLTAIRKDTGLAVSEPVRALDGKLVVKVHDPDLPGTRDCTVLRWLRGRHVAKQISARHFRLQGRAMAQLHNHSERWSPRSDSSKRRYDYDGLFKDNAGAGISNREAWAFLPDRHRSAYEAVACRIARVMNDWGKEPSVYGLIHADCGVDVNVLFWRDEAQIIDFDDSGFGYYLYDLAVALEHCWEEPKYPDYLDAYLEGYTAFRSLDDQQLSYVNLFRSAFYVYMGLWTLAMDQTFPGSPNKAARHDKWLGYGMRFIERYLEGG